MKGEYLLTIPPQLLSAPEQVWRLPLVALRQNLAAHSAVNKSISTTGNKAELHDRLLVLLRTRMEDLDVVKMWEEGLALGEEDREEAKESSDDDDDDDEDDDDEEV